MAKGTGGFLYPDKIIEEFEVQKGMKIADFGCGAGYFSISLAKTVEEKGKVYAIDVLETALESIKNKAKAEGLFNVETVRANLEVAEGSKLENDSMDMVLLSNILFQSPEKQDIIKEAKRVIKEKGKIVIVEWESNQFMGPPEKLIVNKDLIKKMAKNLDLKLKKEFPAGNNHLGMIFTK